MSPTLARRLVHALCSQNCTRMYEFMAYLQIFTLYSKLKARCLTNVFPLSAHHYNITLMVLHLRLVRTFIAQMITRVA